MKNVYFLCYSRYVIFVAYILKKTLHQDDKVTLIISDGMLNEDNISEYIRSTGLWDEVILFHEEGQEPAFIENEVIEFVNSHNIDYFYVAHIMRCASHYFVKYLKENTEVNMFDEGCITLDWIGSYRFYTQKGLKTGWVDFDFERVDKIYSFFPSITKVFGKAIVKPIELESIMSDHFINELNLLFNYEYKKENIDVLFIDNNGASSGLCAAECEQHYIDNILQHINTNNCYIKIKPSESKEVIENKFGKYNVKFIHGGMVPFEVIYLNMLMSECFPKMIIAVNSALIWNMLLFNQTKNIKLDMILLFNIMSEYYVDEYWKNATMLKVNSYLSCLNSGNEIHIPSTWGEVYDIFSSRHELFKEPKKDKLVEDEQKWIRSQYMNLLRKERYITNPRFYILDKWFSAIYSGKTIMDYFREKNIQKIILYGIGYFGDLFIKAVRGTELEIEFIVVTNAGETQKEIADISIYSLYSYIEIKEQYQYPILITAIGRENEIKDLLIKNEIHNEIILFKDIVDAL